MSRLRKGEWLASAAAVGLFVVLFFDWFGVSFKQEPSVSSGGALLQGVAADAGSGWSTLGWFMVLLLCVSILGGLSLSYMTAKRASPAWPIGTGVLTVALGTAVALALALRVLDLAGDTSLGTIKIAIGVQLPAYLGLLFAFLIPVGGLLSIRDERTDSPEARAYVQPPARPVPEG